MISTTPPTKEDWPAHQGSSGITVKILANPFRLAIYDHIGAFLCVIDDHDEMYVRLAELIEAEREPFPDPVRRGHYRLGAREIITPGQGLANEQRLIETHAQQRKEWEKKRALASGDVSLESLGLI